MNWTGGRGTGLAGMACLLALLVPGFALSAALPEDYGGTVGLGLNYPGLGLRYCFPGALSIEARGQMALPSSGTNAAAYGGRVSLAVYGDQRVRLHVAAEADSVSYKDNDGRASGFAGAGLGGIEVFLRHNLSVQADAGPAYVSLSGSGVSAGSVHFVVDFGITYYLGATPAARAAAAEAAPRAGSLRGAAGEKPTIALADLDARGVSASDAGVIADMFRTELVKGGQFQVVEKSSMDRVLAEQSFQQTGCTSAECAVKLGKILNVKYLIVGSFSRLMGQYILNFRVIEVESAKVVYSDSAEKLGSQDQVSKAVTTLCRKLGSAVGR